MYKSFRRDPAFLTRYHVVSASVLLGLDLILFYLFPMTPKQLVFFVPALLLLSSTQFFCVAIGLIYCLAVSHWMQTPPTYAYFLPLVALPLTLFLTALLHNASHDNVRPKWLRQPVGEICGLIQLVGFRDWVVVHTIHHAHSDDPIRDPHPPMSKGYWQFMLGMRESVLSVLAAEYFFLWRKSPSSLRLLKQLSFASRIEQFAKLYFWRLLLGEVCFTYLFVTSVVTKMLHYAWFNYVTHRPEGENVEIKNLNSPLYRVANFFSFGLYFHRNHHQNPKLFDPRQLHSQKTSPAGQEAA